jgi:hypothetical protein
MPLIWYYVNFSAESMMIMPAFGVQLEQHYWRYERSDLDYTWVRRTLSLVVIIFRYFLVKNSHSERSI